tara:strand:+ start:229 stop:591 length:363 start_codon:yes stop_codon:yes gene_type:complete
MTEIKVEESEWEYVGTNSKGKPKFRRYTNQTLQYVTDYLDNLGVSYLTKEEATLIFIYTEKDPESQYSQRYSYYYSTGRWGTDKRVKHYHSKGIEHFMETYYETHEQKMALWEDKRKKDI